VSNSPAELEILLAPGSTFHIVNKWRFEWGKDDQEIYRLFGPQAVDHQSMWGVKEFWWIELRQESPPKR
jgi:hypothetical protein